MGRSWDDCDSEGPNTSGIWAATLRRVIAGPRGQANLRDLDAAFADEWEWTVGNGRLISSALCRDGEVCAVGLLARKRMSPAEFDEVQRDWDENGWDRSESMALSDTIDTGVNIGLQMTLAEQIALQNDDDWGYRSYQESPEDRFLRMWKWTRSQLIQKTTGT